MTGARPWPTRNAFVGCARCGGPLSQTAYGEVCTVCVFGAGLGSDSDGRVGPYELLQSLDQGGTSTVYIAQKHGEHDGLVALKLARPEVLENAEAVVAYRNGARIQKALRDLPNIVSTYEIGTHADGRPYSVMPLLEGGTLADAENRASRTDPLATLALMIKLARAVQLAHERGVLHCDLKAANILFNVQGEPFITDFGLGRIMATAELTRGASFRGGTPGWMSPEQAQQQELTTASDVFSLGVMMYWLLSGVMPFGEGDDSLRRVTSEPAAPLSTLHAGRLRWELDQICARVLQKQPQERYRSAAELADDLVRAHDGLPIDAERRRPVRRAVKWMRRHKIAALAGVELSMLLLYLPLMPLPVVGEVKHAIRDQISFSAVAQAGAVMNELRASAHRLQQAALAPEVQSLVSYSDVYAPPSALIERVGAEDALSVFSADGTLRARWPEPRIPWPSLAFGFRDYFQGQLRIAEAGRHDVYVARAFHSTGDEEAMLGLSTPLYADGEYIGALLGRTRARATFGAMQMGCGKSGTCLSALLGPRDRDVASESMPTSIYVLAAPGVADGQEVMLDDSLARMICARFDCQPAPFDQFEQAAQPQPIILDDYEDPLSHHRSMAALAPVGRTGLIVVVAAPNHALYALTERVTDRITTFLWVPLLLGLLLLAAATLRPEQRT